MINDGINDIPSNSISIFPNKLENGEYVPFESISRIIEKPSKKRDWFTPHFYRCLPLTIANSYGFIIKTEFDFGFQWNGGEDIKDVSLYFNKSPQEMNNLYPSIVSHFGSGIITVSMPFSIRTPPEVNIMTINPPNYIIPNITVMSGVVETDNLRRDFTFNLKIQTPNVMTFIDAGTPIAAFIPVPRYFSDSFEIVEAKNLFSQDLIEEEFKALQKAEEIRTNLKKESKTAVDRLYLSGTDVYGNKFKDHQGP